MELWDVYDKKGRKTGALKEKEADYLPGEYHLAVEAWVFNRRREILIQQRSWHREILPGKWSLTTGRIIAGEDSEQGCVRELKEELGMQVKQKELSFLRRIVREDPLIWDIYFTLQDVPVEELRLQKEEVIQARWVSFDQFRAYLKRGSVFRYPEIDEVLEPRMDGWMISWEKKRKRRDRKCPAAKIMPGARNTIENFSKALETPP